MNRRQLGHLLQRRGELVQLEEFWIEKNQSIRRGGARNRRHHRVHLLRLQQRAGETTTGVRTENQHVGLRTGFGHARIMIAEAALSLNPNSQITSRNSQRSSKGIKRNKSQRVRPLNISFF